MCLAIPGKVVRVEPNELGLPQGEVSFGGVRRRVSLAYTPEARVGDYVLVHVGFAIGTIDDEEAERILGYLREMGEMGEMAELGGPTEMEPPPR